MPEAAKPLPGAAELLGRLAHSYARVAVLSGRPVAFLSEQLAGPGAGGIELFGLYGMERGRNLDDGTVAVEESEAATAWRGVLSGVASDAHSAAPPGVTVEHKGLAVTIHYRRAPEHASWATGFADESARRTGLSAHPGKMSVELRPPVGNDKGTIVEEQSTGLRAVFFAGDDIGDLPAFEALARLRATGVTVCSVAVAGAETPPEVIGAADALVEGPDGLLVLLAGLLPETG